MEIAKWLRLAWDRVAAFGSIAAGAVALIQARSFKAEELVGLKRRAVWYSGMACSRLPWLQRMLPRPKWAMSLRGSHSSAA